MAHNLVWVPVFRKQVFEEHIKKLQDDGNTISAMERKIDEVLVVPTYFRPTEFSGVFQ